jgi:uncharacterized protein (DUF2236 family)
VFFGDKAAADRAGEVLRMIHRSCEATDPTTGERYHASKPELLEWVYNSLNWAMLRGAEVFGPSLSSDDQDRFVVEQRTTARMVGLDPDAQVTTRAELDAYMVAVLPKLAYGYDTRWFKAMTVPTTFPKSPGAGIKQLMQWGSVTLFLPEHRDLFGISWNRLRQITTIAAVKAVLTPIAMKPFDQVVPQLRQFVDEAAFGSPKRKIDPGPRGGNEATEAVIDGEPAKIP